MTKLTKKQRDFLDALIPLSWHVENLTQRKAIEYKEMTKAYGYSSILFIAQVLIATDWGNHPICQETYKSKPCNNLLLIQPTPLWDGPRAKYEGQDYCMYIHHEEFAVEFSDHIVFSGLYDKLLNEKNYFKQIEEFCLTSDTSYDSIEEVLILLGVKQEWQRKTVTDS